MKRFCLAVASVLSLSACTTKYVPVPISLPANLAQDCPEIKELNGNSMKELLEHDIELMKQYADCRDRHKATVRAVEESDKDG